MNMPHLTDSEKKQMRLVLGAYMRAHPLPVRSPWYYGYAVRIASPILAALLLFVGTTYAAQGALPGDLLYPVKINLNEQVEVTLATNPVGKAEVEAALAQRRVDEAQTLALRGTLDATTTAELQSNFDAHASEAISLASEADSQDDAATSSLSLASTTISATAYSIDTATTTDTATTSDRASTTTSQQKDTGGSLVSDLRASLGAQADILNTLKLQVAAHDLPDMGIDDEATTTATSTTDSVLPE